MDLQNRLVYIPTAQLEHHPKNPRAAYSGIEELAESIKAKGIMQNLTVVKADNDKYFVVIGNRRLEAARMAGLAELPCAIAEMTEQEIVSTMLVENIQRSDLTVYEEAQGFQLMLDLGETVSTIAEKTGFSETTVRRRVKLTELDRDKLKKASEERQISLTDLARLDEIKDIETRNKLLDVIGTNSFNYELSRAKDDEKRAGKEAMWRELAKKHKLTEIDKKDRWSGKYTSVETVHSKKEFEGAIGNGAEFFSPEGSTCFLYKKAKAGKKPEKTPEQIEQEECYNALSAESERMYNSRLEYVKSVTAADVKDCAELIAKTIVREGLEGRIYNVSGKLGSVMGVDSNADGRKQAADDAFNEPLTALFKFAYCTLDDVKWRTCFNGLGEYEKNATLLKVYEFLEGCGYQVSDAEKDILSGKSELFYCGREARDAIRAVFSEDAFDETFVGKMYEILKAGADKDEMCKLVSEYAKGKLCDYCEQDDKCAKNKPNAKCWKGDEYYIEESVEKISARYWGIRRVYNVKG